MIRVSSIGSGSSRLSEQTYGSHSSNIGLRESG
jgi:hypothetical protein